jgi:hypothetical protein
MKLLFFILPFLSLQLYGQENQTSLTEAKVADLREKLSLSVEEEFDGGDVWGTTYYYSNTDSTKIRVLYKYDAGDYGSGEIEFFVINNKLLYQKNLILDWLIESNEEDQSYKLSETIYYFSDTKNGTKLSRQVYTSMGTVSKNDTDKLNLIDPQKQTLAEDDYVKQMKELSKIIYSD